MLGMHCNAIGIAGERNRNTPHDRRNTYCAVDCAERVLGESRESPVLVSLGPDYDDFTNQCRLDLGRLVIDMWIDPLFASICV